MNEASPVSYGPDTALVVVDAQHDFVSPEGSLTVAGAAERIEAINREIAAAVAGGASVVVTQDWHPAETPHFIPQGGVWPVHCVAGTRGAELVPQLAIDAVPDPIMIRKGTGGEDGYSAFTVADPVTGDRTPTALNEALVTRGIRRVVVTGVALDVCVRATVLDALELGYAVTVVADATAAVNLAVGDDLRTVAELVGRGAMVV